METNLSEQIASVSELLEYELRTDLEEIERLRNYKAVNHFFGPHSAIGSIMAMAPARTVKDFENRDRPAAGDSRVYRRRDRSRR